MENNLSFVSVIIPCRNEEKYIEKCLDSIINQDYPKGKLEVLVVDGMSEDRTRELVNKYSEKFSFIKLLDNSKKFTNFAFNIGLKAARGDVIMIMGAHAGYEKDYISKCVNYLKKYDADNVGGVMKTLPAENTLIAESIAFALSYFFGAASAFRLGSKKLREVDTVFGGCYKRKVFDKVGLFNENLLRSQDMEFNLRLKRAGGKILLAPDIVNYYYPKATLKDFLKHNFSDGIWVILPLKFGVNFLSFRHFIPLIFVSGLIGLLILSLFSKLFLFFFSLLALIYLLISIFVSLKIANREKDIRLFFVLPIIFALRHIGYGLGSIYGLIKIIKDGR